MTSIPFFFKKKNIQSQEQVTTQPAQNLLEKHALHASGDGNKAYTANQKKMEITSKPRV
jgi:hypothetical protein